MESAAGLNGTFEPAELLTFDERAVDGALLIVICILAMGGNLVLWIVVLRTPELHSSSNYLLLCLSAADLLVSIVNMPLTVHTLFKGRWVLSDGMCVATGFTNMFSFVASVMSLCMITLNRYVRVCRPKLYATMYSPRAVLLHVTGVCTLSALLSIPPILGWGEYGYEEKHFFCFCRWQASLSYSIFMVAFCFGGTSSLMTVCYVAIYRKFVRSKRLLAFSNGGISVACGAETSASNPRDGDPSKQDKGPISVYGSVRSVPILRDALNASPRVPEERCRDTRTFRAGLINARDLGEIPSSPEERDTLARARTDSVRNFPAIRDRANSAGNTKSRGGRDLTSARRGVYSTAEAPGNITVSCGISTQIPAASHKVNLFEKSGRLTCVANTLTEQPFRGGTNSVGGTELAASITTGQSLTENTTNSQNGMNSNKEHNPVHLDKPPHNENSKIGRENLTFSGEWKWVPNSRFTRREVNSFDCSLCANSAEDNFNFGGKLSQVYTDGKSHKWDHLRNKLFLLKYKMEKSECTQSVGSDISADANHFPLRLMDSATKKDNSMQGNFKLSPNRKFNTNWKDPATEKVDTNACSFSESETISDNEMQFPALPTDALRDGFGDCHENLTQAKSRQSVRTQSLTSREPCFCPADPMDRVSSGTQKAEPLDRSVPLRDRTDSTTEANSRVPVQAGGFSHCSSFRLLSAADNTVASGLTPSSSATQPITKNVSSCSLLLPRVGTNTSLIGGLRDHRRKREEVRLTSTMLLVILAYVISWLPYCVMLLINVFTENGVPRRLDMVTLLMGYGNSLVNPFIYGWRNVNIRRGYLKLWEDVRSPAVVSAVCTARLRATAGRPNPKVVFEA